ncbi:MAG: MoaD family protein [Candidatus Helarchaeota archaeon]
MTSEQEVKKSPDILTINVNFLGPSQDEVGKRKLNVSLTKSNNNLKELLIKLADQIGTKFKENVFDPTSNKLHEDVTIIVNGRHFTSLDGLETILKSGDDVSIFPPLGGG